MSRIASNCKRFEFSAGSSNKFWEITVERTDVTIRFGRIGSQGQTIVKAFGNQKAAARHAAQLIERKIKKGYRMVP